MSTPLKTNEYITLYDLRGPWAEESAKKIILQRINTKIDTIIKEKDKEREEAVAEARTKLLFLAKDVLVEMNKEYSIDIKYADKKQWLEPDEFERIFLHRFNNVGIEALTHPTHVELLAFFTGAFHKLFNN